MAVHYLEPTVALLESGAFDIDSPLRIHAALVGPDDPSLGLARWEAAHPARRVETALWHRDRDLAERRFRSNAARARLFLEATWARLPAAVRRGNTARHAIDDRSSTREAGSIRYVLRYVPRHDDGVFMACEGRDGGGGGGVAIVVDRLDSKANGAAAGIRRAFRLDDERTEAAVYFSVCVLAIARA